MWHSGSLGLGRAFARRSRWKGSTPFPEPSSYVVTAASPGRGHTDLAWKGWDQRLGHNVLHVPSPGDYRIPPALEAGDLGHSDRNSHLPGVLYSLQCPLSLNPHPQAPKPGATQAQIGSPGVSPYPTSCSASWKHLLTRWEGCQAGSYNNSHGSKSHKHGPKSFLYCSTPGWRWPSFSTFMDLLAHL